MNILNKKNTKHKRIKANDLESNNYQTKDMINVKDNIRQQQSNKSKILQLNFSNYNLFKIILVF